MTGLHSNSRTLKDVWRHPSLRFRITQLKNELLLVDRITPFLCTRAPLNIAESCYLTSPRQPLITAYYHTPTGQDSTTQGTLRSRLFILPPVCIAVLTSLFCGRMSYRICLNDDSKTIGVDIPPIATTHQV
ncbi:hypothetical protein TNCV_1617311 [Trichonephila clavipes]|nr:hypothetical protein TNCV_1617311 [Trichonephila clavipes]